jgi:hypothetical protein
MFRTLVRHFVYRLFDSGGESEDEPGISGILAVLAIPGSFFALIILDKYSSFLRWMRSIYNFDPYTASLPDKYLFIVLSIVVTGLVTVLKWDEIFPDRKDYANLAHLPIPLPTMFFAKLTAVLTAATIFAVDVNASSSILFPVVVTADKGTAVELLRFGLVHGWIMIAASLSTFFALMAIVGIVISVVPKASLVVRVGCVALFLVVLCATPRMLPMLNQGHWPDWYAWMPPLWFLGWYQELQQKATPPMMEAAKLARELAAASLVSALGISALTYRRFFLKIPERVPLRRYRRLLRLPMPAFFLRSPFERAFFPFAIHTLVRSERHCLTLGAFLAIAAVFTVQNPTSPLLFIYFVVTGLRFVMEMPAELPSNWVFQAILDDQDHECRKLARKLLLGAALPAVAIPIWLMSAGALQAVYYGMCTIALVELSILRYRKIPFTCAFPPMRNHAVLAILLYAVGLWVFTGWCGFWVSWMSRQPGRFAWMIPFLAALLLLCRHYRRSMLTMDRVLVFEERPRAAVQVLNVG